MNRADFEKFLIYEKGLQPRSIKAYLEIFRYFAPQFFIYTKYRDVANEIIALKESRHWSDRMTYKVASMCAVYFNWACREGIIDDSPMRLGHGFKKCETKQADFFDWDSDDFKKLVHHPALTCQFRAIIHVLRASGIRNSECCNLKVEDYQDRWLRIREGKGGRERHAPIDETAGRYLNDHVQGLKAIGQDRSWLFWTEPDFSRPLNPHTLWKRIYNFGNRIGVKAHPHKFRHSLAGTLISRGADITLAAEILGHKSLSSTKIYTHFKKEKTLTAYDNLLKA